MDKDTARRLCDVTNEFYRQHGASFSETRQSAWAGWSECVRVLRAAGALDECGMGALDSGARGTAVFREGDARCSRQAGNQVLSVFDLACGNLRFESYLARELAPAKLAFFAVDDCDALVGAPGDISYQSLDIVDALFAGASLGDLIEAPLCDVSVSFGFMHHVALLHQREAVLAALVGQTRPGGFVIVSFWCFLHDAKFAAKAYAEHERSLSELGLPPLGRGDCVLGWKNTPGAYRYCHSFTDEEIDHLVASVAPQAVEVARFAADGRTHEMNAYLVLQVR